MANLGFTKAWSNVYQLETADDVLAGPGMLANEQAQSLGNRTEKLLDYITGGAGFGLRMVNVGSSSTTSLLASDKGTLYLGSNQIQIPDAASADDNTIFAFWYTGGAGSWLRIYPHINAPMFRMFDAGTVVEMNIYDGLVVICKYPGDTMYTVIGRVRTGVPGEIKAFGNLAVPVGWTQCNGGTFSSFLYPYLYAALGTTTLPNIASPAAGTNYYIHF